ncbi:MAG: DUF262 domain-containing protein [Myxococcales bacterium]|nr:DUF262 domain-containing protein [Myxococcales bacterium]
MTATGTTFSTSEPLLSELLNEVRRGNYQLPDFQRGWVWEDERIKKLIASISLSYPIGAAMLLETGGEGSKFKPRTIEGVELAKPVQPSKLILDGQQRLTSLFASLMSGKPVKTCTEKNKEKRIERVYYLEMTRCLDAAEDRNDAVRSLPPSRMLTSDFGRNVDLDVSTTEKEYAVRFFPLALVYDNVKFAQWKNGFQRHYNFAQEPLEALGRFEMEVWLRFQQYKVPLIELLRDTPKEAVCHVFENVNMGGVPLTVFELLTAIYAADDFELRADWATRNTSLHQYPILRDVDGTDFIMSATLSATHRRSVESGGAIGCRRKDILDLKLDAYVAENAKIHEGFVRAARFLNRARVYETRTLPYQTQLIPLSVICSELGGDFEKAAVHDKLARWYWCGVFGELYGSANEGRYAFDVPEVLAWIGGGAEPRTVKEATFSPMRLLSMQTRLSAAYKGVMALLLDLGARDFRNGDPLDITNYYDVAVDIHHIFPRAHCEKMGYERDRWNSVINKSPITAKANRTIGGHKPSTYLASLEREGSIDARGLDELLPTHAIAPHLLRADDFDGFIRDRASRLLDLIEDAMGKPVEGRDSAEVCKTFGGALVRGTSGSS